MNWIQKIARSVGLIPIWQNGQPVYPTENLEQLVKAGYVKNSIASACINMIATSAPEAKLKVYRETSDGEIEVPDHWLIELIQHPNNHMSTFELWELTHIYLNTGGVAYWELVRPTRNPSAPVIEVLPLRPDRMKVIPDRKEYIGGYQYEVNGQSIIYEPWEILAFPLPNPIDEFRPLSPLARVARELGIDNETTDFTKTFFENNAVPGGILSTDQQLMEEESDRIELRWWQRFRGRRRGRIAVLGKGATYQQLSMSFKEMEFESLRAFTETRICAAFGVDPVLLPSWVGIRYGGKYSNYAEARRHLWDETIIPALRRIETKITTLLEEGLVAKFDVSKVQALQENENDKYTRIISAYEKGLITKNEGRLQLGYEEVSEDEVGFTDNQQQEPEQPQQNEEEPNQEETQEKSFFLTKSNKNLLVLRLHLVQDQQIPQFRQDLQAYFKRINNLVNQSFNQKLSGGEFTNILAFLQAQKQTIKDDLQQIANDHIPAIVVAGARVTMDILEGEFSTNAAINAFINRYVPKFVNQVTDTTLEDLRSILIKAQDDGWSIQQTQEAIQDKFNLYDENRAEMIARTEMIRASNMGARISYEVFGIKEMTWLDTDDNRTCPICKTMDGKTVAVGQPFAALGETIEAADGSQYISYETVEVPPVHPNCRCTILPIL